MNTFKRFNGFIAYSLEHALSVYWTARASHIQRSLDPQPFDMLLDVGCGNGRWSLFFSKYMKSVHSIDVRMEQLSLFENGQPSVFPTCASATGLPYPESTFSKMLAVDVIEHISEDRTAINEMLRVLKPGGRLVVTTLLADRPHYFSHLEFDDHEREYDQAGLERLFEIDKCSIEEIFYFYYAPGMLAREIQSIGENAPLGSQVIIKAVRVSTKVALGVLFSFITRIDKVFSMGKPGGIGIVVKKMT